MVAEGITASRSAPANEAAARRMTLSTKWRVTRVAGGEFVSVCAIGLKHPGNMDSPMPSNGDLGAAEARPARGPNAEGARS
jgi:hypothetical protein